MKVLHIVRNSINVLIDSVYPPFQKFIPKETFRYAVCGGANTTLDIFLYFINYNFILKKKDVHILFFTMSPHIAAFLMAFCITFVTGFLLAKYITFTESDLHGRIQLFRYGVTVVMCILLNYVFLKLFVEYFNIYPTVSKILTTGIVVIYSYFSQKYFSFKATNANVS